MLERFLVKRILFTGRGKNSNYLTVSNEWTSNPFDAQRFDTYPGANEVIKRQESKADRMYQIEKVFV